MRKFIKILLISTALIFLLVVSLQSVVSLQQIPEQLSIKTLIATPQSSIEKETLNINEMPIEENMDLYQYDDPGSVVYMYVTVHKGNPSDNTDHTWQEVNDFTKFFFEKMEITEVGKAEVILQIGNENGPIPGELGYGEIVPNGTIQIRGASSSMMKIKSYKIELFNRAGLWRGQRTIALNKHVFDRIRARNKLCFDLIKDIPNMVSLRTQFVHLFVKDETTILPSKVFVDYGLFTQIEQPNGRFLENHLLDRFGQLYKTTFFEFFQYSDEIRMADDPLYDQEKFSEVLEIKGNTDHSKLIKMLEDINNYAIPIEKTFEKYFDSDNFFTWKAFNILVGNIDTNAQNYYLYSPQNGEKWYFLPWDYDAALSRQYRDEADLYPPGIWEIGISNEWGVVLHNRVFKVQKYRDSLSAKIEELMRFLTPERIQNMLAIYKTVTDKFITSMPDVLYASVTLGEYNKYYQQIPSEIQMNYELYLESLKLPMPFYLGTPQVNGRNIEFIWEESYDFDAQDIRYHFQVSRGWDFKNVIADYTQINLSSIQIPMLEPGAYFWRVIATNEDGKDQNAFDYYRDTDGNRHFGIKYFYIDPKGNVLEQPT